MVMRTIEIREISLEVEQERQAGVMKKISGLYPDLGVSRKGGKVSVSGDLRNYRKRDRILYILSGGKHGSSV